MGNDNAFFVAVWNAARTEGMSAPRITDRIIRDLWPNTAKAAADEGADLMFRRGVIASVKFVLRRPIADPAQIDMAQIAPSFSAIVEKLKRPSYQVPSLSQYVGVADLIRNPDWLDEARKFMRQKGEECLAEAKTLDQLYREVTGNTSPSIVPDSGAPAPQEAA